MEIIEVDTGMKKAVTISKAVPKDFNLLTFMRSIKKSPKHTPEEIAEAIIFPVNLSPIQKKEATKQLIEARKKGQQEMSDNDRLSLRIFQLKFQMEDYI